MTIILWITYIFSLGVVTTRLEIYFTAQMIQGFLCYQVIDPFQAASNFNAPIILAILCCLQQACLQSVRSQIVRNSVSLSSSLCKGVDRGSIPSHFMQNVNILQSHLDDLRRNERTGCKECIHFCMEAEQNVNSLNCMQ